MDINILRSVMTVVFFVVFVGIVLWAFSKHNKSRFDSAANLPFADDQFDRTPAPGVKHG